MLAGSAAQTDVRAQAHDRPVRATAGVRLAQANDIPNVNLDKLGRAHPDGKTDAIQRAAVALGVPDPGPDLDQAALIAARRRSASARAAACQSEPALAYRIERLALTMAPPPAAPMAA